MNEHIVIYFSNPDLATAHCAELDSEGIIFREATLQWTELEQFCEHWDEKSVKVIIPGELCSHIQTKIPARSRKQILTALPFSVEEQFSQDIDQIHFAIGNKNPGGNVTAESIEKQWLQNLLEKFHEINIFPLYLYADYQLLPNFDNAHSLYVKEDKILVNMMDGHRFCCNYDFFMMTFSKLFVSETQPQKELNEDTPHEVQMPKCFIFFEIFNEKQQQFYNHFLEQFSHQLNIIIDQESGNEVKINSDLEFLTPQIDSKPINFLQQSFKQQKAINKNWKLWKSPLVAVAVFLVLAFTHFFINYQNKKHQLDNILNAQKKTYLQIFKNEKRVLRPVSQMRGKLKRMGVKSSAGNFLALIEKLSSAKGTISTTQISDISFRAKRGEMKIDFIAPDFSSIQKFQDQLKSLGLNIKPGSTNQYKDAYKGRVTITESGS